MHSWKKKKKKYISTLFIKIFLIIIIHISIIASSSFSSSSSLEVHENQRPNNLRSCSKLWEYYHQASSLSDHLTYTERNEIFLKAINIIKTEMKDDEKKYCKFIHRLYHNYANFHASVGNVNETFFYFNAALSIKREGITLVQYAVFLSLQDQIFKAYDFFKEASENHFQNQKDIEIRAATLLPVVSSSRKSLNKVLVFLDKRLTTLENAWYKNPPFNQIDPQSMLRWSPTIYRLHYLSKNMTLNLNFLKRKAKLNYWMTNSLKYVSKHLLKVQDSNNNDDYHRLHTYPLHKEITTKMKSSKKTVKIKIGFVSSHFCKSHSLFMHIGQIIQNLPRSLFHVHYIRGTAIACQNEDEYIVKANLAEDTDVYINGRLENLNETRSIVSNLKLDILVNVEIGMEPMPYFLGFARLAPVQMSSWCFVATSGIEDTIDYFISAEHLEPNIKGSSIQIDTGYTEQVVQFHHSPWILRRDRERLSQYACKKGNPIRNKDDVDELSTIAIRNLNRKLDEVGIPFEASIITCAQIHNKFHPDFDHLLLSILKKNPNSVYVVIILALSMGSNEYTAIPFLKNRIRTYLGPTFSSRVKFLPRIDRLEYLELTFRSKVILDTLPWSAFTTAHETIQLGMPLVTLPGPDIRGRFPYRLYKQMNFLDLVAKNVEDYVNIVTRLCNDPVYFKWVRMQLLHKGKLLSSDISMTQTLEEWVQFFQRAYRLVNS